MPNCVLRVLALGVLIGLRTPPPRKSRPQNPQQLYTGNFLAHPAPPPPVPVLTNTVCGPSLLVGQVVQEAHLQGLVVHFALLDRSARAASRGPRHQPSRPLPSAAEMRRKCETNRTLCVAFSPAHHSFVQSYSQTPRLPSGGRTKKPSNHDIYVGSEIKEGIYPSLLLDSTFQSTGPEGSDHPTCFPLSHQFVTSLSSLVVPSLGGYKMLFWWSGSKEDGNRHPLSGFLHLHIPFVSSLSPNYFLSLPCCFASSIPWRTEFPQIP